MEKLVKAFGEYVRPELVARVKFTSPTRVSVAMVDGGGQTGGETAAAKELLEILGVPMSDPAAASPSASSAPLRL